MSAREQILVIADTVGQLVDDLSLICGVHPYCLLGLLALALLLSLMLLLAPKPVVAKFESVRDRQLHQQRINKIRANSKLFTPPYPNGWYCVCRSHDLAAGDVIPISAFGRELVCFRGKGDKQVGALHAFCPHLGTHLGHGGHVESNSVVCPYHAWGFDKTGQCTQIPYCERDIKAYGARVNAKPYECVEAAGCVLVWFHADNEPSFYQPTLLQEIDELGFAHIGDFEVDDWHMHLTEPSQNSCDWYHFKTVHQWLGQSNTDTFKWVWVQHACKTHMSILGANPSGDKLCKRDALSPNGAELPPEMIVLEESPVKIRLLGWIPIPSFMFSHFKAEAWFQGPQLSVFRVRSWLFGECRTIFNFTAEKPFLQRCVCRSYCSWRFPHWMARFMARHSINTIEQDRKVWENKLSCNPRNLVAKDGPFAAYGTWVKQFYSESSSKWGESSLDW